MAETRQLRQQKKLCIRLKTGTQWDIVGTLNKYDHLKERDINHCINHCFYTVLSLESAMWHFVL